MSNSGYTVFSIHRELNIGNRKPFVAGEEHEKINTELQDNYK